MDIFPVNSTGIVTASDDIVIDFDRSSLIERLTQFVGPSISDETIRQRYFGQRRANKYAPGDTRGWKLPEARVKLQSEHNLSNNIRLCLYRPFDIRYAYYTSYMVDWPRPEVMRHMLAGENIALCVGRAGQVVGPRIWDILLCSSLIEDFNLFYRGGNVNFLLYLYPVQGEFEKGRRPNLNPEFIRAFSEKLELSFVDDGKGDLQETFGPEDIFNYAYAIFHSPTIRKSS